MPVRNQNWYDLQAGRRYPLDDRSTGLDDAGQLINDDIIVDCNIQFPNTAGTCAFIQAVNVSPNIVTVLIGAAFDLNSSESVTIGAVSLPKPVVANRNYAISALLPGVAGWIVFGYGIANNFSGRYAKPIQTLINPRNAKSYNALPVTGIGKKALNALLTDVIVLEAESPVVLERKELQINGKTANAVIFKLDAARNDLPYNPLQYFLGPCGQRPESGTCPKQPIETINGIAPDCDGNINIVADNLLLRAFENCGGLGLDLPIGLEDTCAKEPYGPPRTPVDDCAPSSSSAASSQSSSSSATTPSGDSSANSSSSSESAVCLTLPLCQNFYAPLPAILTTRAGQFGLGQQLAPAPCTAANSSSSSSSSSGSSETSDSSSSSSSSGSSETSDSSSSSASSESSSSSSSSSSRSSSSSSSSSALPALTQRTVATALSITQLNIATLNNCATDWAIGRQISADFKIVPGGQNNVGLLVNYLTAQMNSGLTTYLVAGVDLNQNVFYLKRYNGSTFVNEFSLSLREISFVFDLNAWHTISITPTVDVSTGIVSLRCGLKRTIGGAEIYFATSVENYGMISGATGLFSNNTLAHFSALRIE